MVGLICRTEMQIFPWLGWYSVLDGIWDLWIRIWAQNSDIRNSGSDMADDNPKSYSIGMKFASWEFWDRRLVITYPGRKIRISHRRIKYRELKCKQLIEGDEIWYSAIFGVADNESEMNIQKFKMLDPLWLTNMQKIPWMGWILVPDGFWGCWLRI